MGNVLSSLTLLTGTSQLINSNIGVNVNAIGYNTLDNLIYGIQTGTNNLIVIDSNGNVGYYGQVLNLPIPASLYEVGAIDGNGHLFIMESGSNTFYTIDVNTSSTNFGKLVDPTNGFALDTSPYGTTLSSPINITDWTINYNDGFLYSATPAGNVIRVNQFTGQVTTLTTTGLPAAALGYGPSYSISDGFIYLTNNDTGAIYRISISGNNATATLFSNDIATTQNDGASCLNGVLNIDFGDAPDSGVGTGVGNYRSLLIDNGPRQGVINNLILGTNITSESDAYQNSDATGDDISKGIQDDGTSLPLHAMINSNSTYSITESVLNNTGSAANLYAWIDFNQDGIFQTNEGTTAIVPSSAVNQNVNLTFNVPYALPITSGTSFMRVRLTTDNLVNTGGATGEDTRSYGPAINGEVEDYALPILSISKAVDKGFAEVGEVLTYTITINNPSLVPVTNTFFQDSIPPGTTYNNNLFVSSVYTGTTPQGGLTILNINPGQVVTISYQVLIGNTLPVPNPILNTATITPQGGIATNTNTVSTQVYIADLSIVKAVDKAYAQIGDELVYTTTITNTGNATLTNVVFTDPPPSETTFIPNSLTINGVLQAGVSPSSNISLGPLLPNGSIVISFRVTVTSLPPSPPYPPEITNTSNATFSYYIDPSLPQRTKSKVSNEVVTSILQGSLVLTKAVDKVLAKVGDTLTYTIFARNNGNVQLNNLIVTDIIPSETSFISGSVTINGVSSPASNPASGITVGNLNVGDVAIITFLVKINTQPPSGQIENTATATFSYILDPTEPPITGSATSNTVITTVYEVQIEMEKIADKATVNLSDVITYYFVIRNTGTIAVNNFIFKDTIPDGTTYVSGSFTVNGTPILGADPTVGVNLGTIPANSIVQVSFQVKVTSLPCNRSLTNYAQGTYEYNGNTGAVETGSVTSNSVVTTLNSFAFKQLYLDKTLTIPTVKPDIEGIIDLQININICSTTFVNTSTGVSNEGQILSGRKLMICGEIEQKLQYVALVPDQSNHLAHFSVPFCEYIIIDENITTECQFNVVATIEDLYYQKINSRSIFENITFKLEI